MAVTWLKVAEVAGMLRVTPMTVYRMVESGELPAIQFGGKSGKKGTIRIPAAAMAEFLAEAWVGEIPDGYRLSDLLGETGDKPADVRRMPRRPER